MRRLVISLLLLRAVITLIKPVKSTEPNKLKFNVPTQHMTDGRLAAEQLVEGN